MSNVSASGALSDPVLSAVRGCTDAQHLLAVLAEGGAPANALHDAVMQLVELGDMERLRGLLRGVQKVLESRR